MVTKPWKSQDKLVVIKRSQELNSRNVYLLVTLCVHYELPGDLCSTQSFWDWGLSQCLPPWSTPQWGGIMENLALALQAFSQRQHTSLLLTLHWSTKLGIYQFSSVHFSRSVVSDSLRPHESQHTRPPCPSPSPGVHSDSHPLSPWCHPAISSSVVPFSSCPQSLPASESFPMSQLFAWGGQSTGASALASFLRKKSQGWSPSEWTGWISLQSKGPSRVFSNTTVQKHQFMCTQLSL